VRKKLIIGIDVSPLYSGHKVRGVGFYTRRLLTELKRLDGLEVKELRSREEIDQADYHLLHFPYFTPYFFSLPWRKKRPLVVTIHDLIPVKYPDHYPPGIKGRLRWEIQKKLLKKVDLVITDSFASKYDIAELTGYPQDKIFVVYLAADTCFRVIKNRRVLTAVKRRYHLPDQFVLYVGDLNWNKNVPGLVRACRRIGVPLVIAGKQAVSRDYDPAHPENRDLVWLQKKARRSKKIILLGFVSSDDLAAVYNLAGLYCQPSFDEGFGLPVLEAMACGCPVVSSNRGSLPEVVGSAGLVVDPDERSLASAIERVLRDRKERVRLVRLGREQVKEFSWLKTAKETKKVYQLLAG